MDGLLTRAQSWTRKPSNDLDLDLEGELAYDDADEMSLRQSRFESIALPHSSTANLGHSRPVSEYSGAPSSVAEVDEDQPRVLGGKAVVSSSDVRRLMSGTGHDSQ